MAIGYQPPSSSNLVGDPAEGGAFSSGNAQEISAANSAAAAAQTSATNAATSETNASNSETAAASSAASAASSASAASISASTANASALAAQAAYDDFDDTYLGAKATAPTTDNDGDALEDGALYFNTTDSELYVWSGSAWQITAVDGSLYAELAGATFTGNVEAPEFIGPLQGEVIFKAKAGEALSKGDAVYVSGISGNTPVVSKADADGAATYPAFGLAASTVSVNGNLNVVTLGQLTNIDTSMFSLGDTLYLSTTPGVLTNVPPGGEASKIQNVGKVEREHATTGAILVVNSGRTAATPNLNDGNIFLGNASNKAVTADLGDSAASALSTKTIDDLTITSLTAGDLTVDTNTLYVDATNDRVGIGTTSPEKELHVAGDARIKSAFPRLYLTDTDSNSDFSIINNNGKFSIYDDTNTAYRMAITSSGNIGIGTTNPSTDLHVISTTNAPVLIETTHSGGNSRAEFRNENYRKNVGINNDGSFSVYDITNSKTPFVIDNNVNSNTLVLNHDSKVGINTTNPAETLHVNGTGKFNNGIVFDSATGNTSKTSSSNVLDEYEEGTFSVEVADASSGGNTATLAAGTQAYYTKIGRLVTINLRIININTTGMTATNQVFIRNLPFNTRSSHVPAETIYTVQVDKGTNVDVAVVGSGNSKVLPVRFVAQNGSTSACTVEDLNSGSAQFIFSISYITPT